MKRFYAFLAFLTQLTLASYAAVFDPEAIYSVESPLVAETLADVAYRVTNGDGRPVKDAKGQLFDEDWNLIATFTTDENGQGLFFFVPKMCRYQVQWCFGGEEFTTDFLPVKKSGYVLSVDNTSNATFIPFDTNHPYWNRAKKESYSDLELEQLSKMKHRITTYRKKTDITQLEYIESSHLSIMTGNVGPVSWGVVSGLYSYGLQTGSIQGKNKPKLPYLEYCRPQDVTENIRVWVERPESMKGSALRVAIFRGDTKQDEDVIDLSKSTYGFLSFPLRNIEQGDIEVRLLDSKGHLLATRDAKASRYMVKKKYVDARKTDLDLRLRHGVSYPLIATADWTTPENSGLRICFSPEGGSLIAGVRSQVAFSAMTDSGEEVAVDGEVYSSKDSLQTAFASWSSCGGSFFLKPEKGESYYATVNYNGRKYKAALPEVKDEGWMLGVDCLTLLDSNEDNEDAVEEFLDRLNYWGAFWEDGETYTRENIGETNELDRVIHFRLHQGRFLDDQILKTYNGELTGKYKPKTYVISSIGGGYSADYQGRDMYEDDIKVRLVNNNADKDMLEFLLTDDEGTVYDSQRIVMFNPEAWVRFPLDGYTPEGNLNIIVANHKGERLCSRRFNTAHYSTYRDYRTARERDIRNILGVRRYAPATPTAR